MYTVTLKTGLSLQHIVDTLLDVMENSPFEAVTRSAKQPAVKWVTAHRTFDQGGIHVERPRTGVIKIQFMKVQLREQTVRASRAFPNGRRTRHLDHEDWIDFNERINRWLDILAPSETSSDAKSSSYVIRSRNKSRTTFTPGDYHGVRDEWREVEQTA